MPDALQERVAAAIRTARVRAGLSQEALAERAAVSLPTINKAERGVTMPSLETFAVICDVLSMDPGPVLAPTVRHRQPSRGRARIEAEVIALLHAMTDRDAALVLELVTGVARQRR